MAEARPRKASAGKRRKRPRARARRQTSSTPGVRGVVIAFVLLLGVALAGTLLFRDRHWHAFDDAGDAAYERGNHAYAERMYLQALQEAQELDDPSLEAASQRDLSRVYTALGRHAEARAAAAASRR
jgi:hypothetical protein